MSHAETDKTPAHRGSAPAGRGSDERHRPIARWAVGLSLAAWAWIAAAVAAFAIAYAVGGSDATEDNWVSYLVLSMASVALLGSFAAFALAIAARVRRDRRALLWLPLCTLPACLLFLVLGEAFWWE